jgi:hypothetical protein
MKIGVFTSKSQQPSTIKHSFAGGVFTEEEDNHKDGFPIDLLVLVEKYSDIENSLFFECAPLVPRSALDYWTKLPKEMNSVT